MESRRVIAFLLGVAFLAALGAGCGEGIGGLPDPQPTLSAQQLVTAYLARQTRTAKADLIQQLASPPRVVILGGSRALRFDPAYIQQRTGLTAFNAAVTQARPEDAWALLNLLHARFPAARFRFLWVLHADEFDRRPIDASILLNPALSRFFPQRLVKSQLQASVALAERRQQGLQIGIPKRGKLIYAPDGYVLSGFFSNATPPPNGHPLAVLVNIRKELMVYASTPVTFFSRSVRYFEKDLRLMDKLSAAPPVIVAAPFDTRIYHAVVANGWGVRHHELLALLAQLRHKYRFDFLDLSPSASSGFVPDEFYDGIHLTPQGAARVIDLVLRRFPRGL